MVSDTSAEIANKKEKYIIQKRQISRQDRIKMYRSTFFTNENNE